MTTSLKEMPGTSASVHSDFKASRKIRNARKIIEYTELRGTTKVRIQAENFVSEEFKVYVEAELFIPQQIFKDCLFWKENSKKIIHSLLRKKSHWQGISIWKISDLYSIVVILGIFYSFSSILSQHCSVNTPLFYLHFEYNHPIQGSSSYEVHNCQMSTSLSGIV